MKDEYFDQWYKLSQLRVDPEDTRSPLLSEIETKEVLWKVGDYNECVIYWHWRGEEYPKSFYFLVTQFCAGEDDETYVNIPIQGVAAFDGIRHGWFYRDPKDPEMHGYANYLNTSMFIKIFQKLGDLKTQYDIED